MSRTQERIRILRVIARLNVGGPALHTTLLTERLDQTRYDTTLVVGQESADEGSYLSLRGNRVSGLVSLPSLGREIRGTQDISTLAALIKIVRKFRPHVVHTHTAKAGTLGRLAAWWCGVPIVIHTYHGHVFSGYFSPAKTRFFVAIERWLARRTTRLIAVSEAVRDELLQLKIGEPNRFEVIPLGLNLAPLIDATKQRGTLRRELGIEPNKALVGIVARLVPIKAHDVFIRAAARVAAATPDAMFVIVGDGQRRGELEALARTQGLEGRVLFLGWRADLDRIYADLDVVALTSRNEGLPVALIEALAAGCGVVSTRVGGVPDLIEHDVNGLLVDKDDVDGLTREILALLTDPPRRRALGQAGQARVRNAFSAERLVTDVDMLYQKLLAST